MCKQHHPRRRLQYSGRPISSIRPVLATVMLLACCGGCATSDWVKLKPEWLAGKKEQYVVADAKNPVSEIVCMWEPTTGIGLDNRTTRGFNGKILFLTRGSKLPAIVDGNVEIYLFDDQGTREEQVKPLHCFEFPGESWNQLVADTPMGLQYGVFIPYVRKGKHRTQCSLRVKHTSSGNVVTYSEMVNVLLEGIDDTKTDSTTGDQAVSNILPVDVGPANQPDNNAGTRTITTRTIRVDSHASSVRNANVTQFPNSPDGTFSGMLETELAAQSQARGNSRGESQRDGTAMSEDEREALIQEAMARLAAQQQANMSSQHAGQNGIQSRSNRSGIQPAAAIAESDEFQNEAANNQDGAEDSAAADRADSPRQSPRRSSQQHLLGNDHSVRKSNFSSPSADFNNQNAVEDQQRTMRRSSAGRQSSTEHALTTDNHLLTNRHVMDQAVDASSEAATTGNRRNRLARRQNPLARVPGSRTTAERNDESDTELSNSVPRNRLYRNRSNHSNTMNSNTMNEVTVVSPGDLRDLPADETGEDGDDNDYRDNGYESNGDENGD